MKIENLHKSSTESIVDCLTKAFNNYFVPVPSEVSFWKTRFENARVNKSFSWGVYQNNHLAGFIINAIDTDNGELTAFNTGTGILPKYRGNQLVDKMYEYGIPQLKNKGVSRCILEVIDKNEKAIKVYERIGFNITHELKCYQGEITTKRNTTIQEIKLDQINNSESDKYYSWDNKRKTILKAGRNYTVFRVYEHGDSIGHFILNPKNGYLAQLEVKKNNWESLFDGIGQVQSKIKINNIHQNRIGLIEYLDHINIPNTVNQYQMEMKI